MTPNHSPSLQDRLSSPKAMAIWLGAVTLLAVAGRVSDGTAAALFPNIVILAIAALALVAPWLGLLALFPLGFALEPAPQGIGLREIGFAAICASICLGALKVAWQNGTLGWNARRFAAPVLLIVAFLALNFAVARGNDISLGYWVRGLIPFLFIALFWPIGIFLNEERNRINWLALSLFIMAVLFSAQIMFVYWYEGLYQAVYYLPDGDDFIRTTAPEDPLNPGDKIGPFYYRVTTFLAQSTDALLPLAFSVGYVVSILSPNRNLRWSGLLLTCLGSTAILTTQTRSMLLCALIAVCLFGLVLLIFQRRHFKRAVLTGIGIIIFSVIMVFAINLDPVWYNRFLQLYYSLGINIYVDALMAYVGLVVEWCIEAFKYVADSIYRLIHWFLNLFTSSDGTGGYVSLFSEEPQVEIPAPGIDPTVFSGDVNVLTRMEEYRIAFGIFQQQPLTGAGLGVRYDILADGQVFKQVGYVHNWVFYSLMTGGIGGALIYGSLLMLPALKNAVTVLRSRKSLEPEEADRRLMIFHAVWVGLATMTLYGLFFAVFRLISFNLLLAAAIGITFHLSMLAKQGEN